MFNCRALSSTGKDLTDPFLIELAKREDANKSGKMTVNTTSINFICSIETEKLNLVYLNFRRLYLFGILIRRVKRSLATLITPIDWKRKTLNNISVGKRSWYRSRPIWVFIIGRIKWSLQIIVRIIKWSLKVLKAFYSKTNVIVNYWMSIHM